MASIFVHFQLVAPVNQSITQAHSNYVIQAETDSTSNTTTIYVPNIKQNASWATALYVRNNHDGASSTVNIYYYNASGTQVGSPQNYNLAANGSAPAIPPNNFTGSAKVVGTKDTSVAVLVEHITPYSIGTYEGVEYPGIKSLVPLVHRNNSGWNNEIFIQNTSASGNASITVNFNASTGNSLTWGPYTLAPQGSVILDTSSSSFSGLGSLFVGSAEVTSNLPVALVYNQYKTNFSSMIQASNAPYMGSDVYAPLIQNSNANYLSGFSAQNLTDAGDLAVTYYNQYGSSCANSSWTSPNWPVVVLPIPPAGNTCPSVTSAKFNGDDGRLMYTQVNQLKNGTDQSSGYAAIAHPTKTAVAPRIYHYSNDYITGIQVQNAGSSITTVTITYYNDAGTQQNTDTEDISPNATYTFFQNVGGTPFVGSAKITAAQPIAATVNFLKSGSGDVLASYTAINRPDGNVTYSTRQGFDMCEAPFISELQTWMNYSPYRFIGIYIGGITRSCDQDNLNSNWVTQTANQGWDFVPLWAGLQPPCAGSQFYEWQKFSPVAGTAYNSGVSEATSAMAAAASLGRTGSIIYYNFEPYTENTTCNTAVRSFISGWVTTLHSQGFKAGAYGLPRNLDDLQNASNPPDAIWAAAWNYSEYNTAASAYGLGSYIPDSLWSGQRIRQYAGDHTTETWGGLNFSPDPIDSNVADGPVTDTPATDSLLTQLGVKVQAMDLLTESEGWALAGQQVFWTADGGGQWANISPKGTDQTNIQAVFFADTLSGWILAQSEKQFVFYSTTDGGKNWQSLPFDGLSLDDNTRQSRIYLNFIDKTTGWMVFKLPSSSNFSRGLLFKTEDGGRSWMSLNIPLGEPVHFANTQQGWLAGGPAGNQLFKTEDGGTTWQAVAIPVEIAENKRLLYGSPILADDGRVLVPVLIKGEEQKETRIYATQDVGASWVLVGDLSPVSATVLDKMTNATLTWLLTQDLSALFLHYDGIRQLDFVTLETGLAYASNGMCIEMECSIESHLLITHDGGQTWTEITLP